MSGTGAGNLQIVLNDPETYYELLNWYFINMVWSTTYMGKRSGEFDPDCDPRYISKVAKQEKYNVSLKIFLTETVKQ